MLVLTLIVVWVGGILGGRTGTIIALGFAAAMNFYSYWFSDKMVLKRYKAGAIEAGHPSGLYELVQNLANKAELPMPKVYITPEATPNAFATGRNPQHAAVAASQVREFAADKEGSEICGKPLALAGALNKIQSGVEQMPMRSGKESDSHMFIINPFFGGMQKLFSTHPPTEERIRRLQELA
ncbi:unnamed protein product, partial [Cyprideis torosa]